MLEPYQDQISTEKNEKSEKVQANLKSIKSLLKEALRELKNSERFSTNESDTSENFIPDLSPNKMANEEISITEEIMQSLEKGYVMVKHSPDSKPKEKYVYVSTDRKFLCWKSLEKSDEKKIELRKINLFLSGEEETITHVKSKSIKTLEKLIIVGSEKRNLELEAYNIEESQKFKFEMLEAIKRAQFQNVNSKI